MGDSSTEPNDINLESENLEITTLDQIRSLLKISALGQMRLPNYIFLIQREKLKISALGQKRPSNDNILKSEKLKISGLGKMRPPNDITLKSEKLKIFSPGPNETTLENEVIL